MLVSMPARLLPANTTYAAMCWDASGPCPVPARPDVAEAAPVEPEVVAEDIRAREQEIFERGFQQGRAAATAE
jgi:hypothetical protein